MTLFTRVFLVTILLMLIVADPAFAQSKADKKAAKKEAEEMQMRENKQKILNLINKRTFVIEANNLQDRHLNFYKVNATTNFVKIDSSQAVIQFGFDNVVGWNGVGGLTVYGKVMSYDISGKKGLGPVSVTANITSPPAGFLTLYLTVFNDGFARATVTGSFGSRLTFTGNFISLAGARTYQGTSSF